MNKQLLLSFLFFFGLISFSVNAQDKTPQQIQDALLGLVVEDQELVSRGFDMVNNHWEDGFVPMLLDVSYLAADKQVRDKINDILVEKTGHKPEDVAWKWRSYIWDKEANYPTYYGDFKAAIYQLVDPKFEKYFAKRTQQSTIRLDEVVWGGVFQDGIPPLRHAKKTGVKEATYLADSNIIFGIYLNGEARAYPKRILAWHEMFVDSIGGRQIAGVYCTLCGTVIPYDTEFNGTTHDLGTSGFLYRSNKLMYDKATQSLWNTIEGKPVVGPLVGKSIELKTYSMVTTTWGEWRRQHPETLVLSLDTGHDRNYDEGVAYQNYFNNDALMFQVPKLDTRIPNKAEVLVIREDGYKQDPLAIDAKYLKKNKIYQDKIGETSFVVLTNASGANRVYASGGNTFKGYNGKTIKDQNKEKWTVTEDALVSESGDTLKRLSSHRIFWFAWYNTYPETRLVY